MAIFTSNDKPTKTDTSSTIISKSAKIKGNIDIATKLHIEGFIEGDIKSNNLISIGVNGKIKGNIIAKKVIIKGEIEGNIDCDELEILEGGKVRGDIIIKSIMIEKNGLFEGTSKIKGKNASKSLWIIKRK